MAWRLLLVILKSALLMALIEVLRPVPDSIGLHVSLIPPIARAISQATALPYTESELLFLVALARTLVKIAKPVWDIITEG